ncbi:MAG: nucleotide exchange factor GrpE [candidate division Zixibacteria bacterium]|nr:nucleotide exchange factor GrpE [candidate division Zixibacteria bacterium]
MSKAKQKKKDLRDQETQQPEPEVVEKEEKEVEPKSETELLSEQLTQSEQKAKELEDRLLRLAAEYDNYRKRTAREFETICRNANENLILKFLETLDNFERALESAKSSNDYDNFHKGVELIYTHLKELLEKEGLKEIEAVCKPFDPNYHEAVTQCESEEHDEGVVVDEVCKGYMLNDKLLRPSKVVVSKAKPKPEKEEKEQTENEQKR